VGGRGPGLPPGGGGTGAALGGRLTSLTRRAGAVRTSPAPSRASPGERGGPPGPARRPPLGGPSGPPAPARASGGAPPAVRDAFRSLGQALPTLWLQDTFSRAQRKALLRCLIDK